MFRKKNRKPMKEGCLKKLIIGVIMVVALGIITIIALKDVLTINGINLGALKEYSDWLNQPVVESQLVTNGIKTGDINSFNEKATASGLKIYDNNNKINFNLTYIELDSTIVLKDYEVGAMINKAMANDENNLFTLLELSIIEETDGFTLKTVSKIDLTSIKKKLGKNANNLPQNIYITNIGKASVVGTRIQTSNNSVFFNNLSQDKNQKLLSFLNEVLANSKDQDMHSVTDINNYIVTELLSDLARKSDSQPELRNHELAYIITPSA